MVDTRHRSPETMRRHIQHIQISDPIAISIRSHPPVLNCMLIPGVGFVGVNLDTQFPEPGSELPGSESGSVWE
jgi:hypothetical protein